MQKRIYHKNVDRALRRLKGGEIEGFYIEGHSRTGVYGKAKAVGLEIRVTINGPESRVDDEVFPFVTKA